MAPESRRRTYAPQRDEEVRASDYWRAAPSNYRFTLTNKLPLQFRLVYVSVKISLYKTTDMHETTSFI